jgi:hypothetical protein
MQDGGTEAFTMLVTSDSNARVATVEYGLSFAGFGFWLPLGEGEA